MYVPRDEQFEESKQATFSFGRLKAVLHNLIPSLKASVSAENHEFSGFSDIDNLYSEGVLIKLGLQDELLKKFPLPSVVSRIQDNKGILKYDTPKILSSEFSNTTISSVDYDFYVTCYIGINLFSLICRG